MRAISQDVHGAPEVLDETVLPRPEPGPSQILVAVRAAGLNPTDWKHRSSGMFLDRLPLVLGWDVSGVVEAVGYGVTLFEPGDEVFGMLPYPQGVGSHAEYVTGPARAFTHKPAAIDHVQAGALPLAALTAYQAIVDTAEVRTGQRVLIHAAAAWRRSPRRPDRQVPRRVRHRHRQRPQARLRPLPRRGRGDRLPHHRLPRRRPGRRHGPRPPLRRHPHPLPRRPPPRRRPRLPPSAHRPRRGGERRGPRGPGEDPPGRGRPRRR